MGKATRFEPLTVGSLFAGIGGIELGLERTGGFKTVWQVEVDGYATRVLEKHWPDVKRWGDVRDFPPEPVDDWRCDVIAGGFPCQPVSQAGRREAESDPRWLWPQFRRVLGILRPRFCLIENVPGLLTRGAAGVLFDLACLGFDAEWRALSARELGAPHVRKRLFLFAYARNERIHLERGWLSRAGGQGTVFVDKDGSIREVAGHDTDSDGSGQPRLVGRVGPPEIECETTPIGGLRETVADAMRKRRNGRASVQEAARTPGGSPAEGGSSWWASESGIRRVAYGVPSRVDRLRCVGNAVVPQVVEWIGRRILEAANG